VSRCACGVPSFGAVHSAPQIEGGHRFVSADTVTRVSDTVAMVVRIDADLHARLKARAVEDDRTMAAVVRRALIGYLDGPEVRRQTEAAVVREEARERRPTSRRQRDPQVQPIPKGKP
jgi:plasmid stability protein